MPVRLKGQREIETVKARYKRAQELYMEEFGHSANTPSEGEKTEPRPLLTEEQQTQLDRALSGYGEQGANGYDLSLFRENLHLTPTERLERLQAAVDFFAEVDRVRDNKLPKID